MKALFGPAGNCERFYDEKHKSSLEIPQWLNKNGLDAYEYQCGKGVKISDDSAIILGERAKENGIALSVHAPYYISLSSTEEEKRLNSIKYILDTMHAAKLMGADRIVVHSGSCAKITRREAMRLTLDTLHKARIEADKEGFEDIFICPETMGKIQQLGNLEEVVEICESDERFLPAIDFGHLDARTLGGLKNKEDFEEIFNLMEKKLGVWRAKNFHAHYSRIEHTNQGEKKHHTFAEKEFGPDFDFIGEIIAERNLTPRIICESAGTQTDDAMKIQEIYLEKRKIYAE